MVAMDVPALVHSAACRNERHPQSLHFIIEESVAVMSLVESPVFDLFPNLKLIISHGGGAVPYQIGRWGSLYWESRDVPGTFEERLRKLYFDTCLYHKGSLELLFDVVGPDRCLFGTERPGDGSTKDPKTGRMKDDLKPVIESIPSLTSEDRYTIFEGNAKKLYTRLGL
jgi:4-oxalmesaconate hydratase